MAPPRALEAHSWNMQQLISPIKSFSLHMHVKSSALHADVDTSEKHVMAQVSGSVIDCASPFRPNINRIKKVNSSAYILSIRIPSRWALALFQGCGSDTRLPEII